jgi:outer membrane protein TolC
LRQAPILLLSEAVRLALDEATTVLDAAANVAESEIALRAARGLYWPKFTSNALGNYGQEVAAGQTFGATLSQRFQTGTEVRASVGTMSLQNQAGTYFASDTTLALGQSLSSVFSPRSVGLDVRNAEVDVAAARQQQSLVRQRVAIDVAVTYYEIVAQQELRDLAEASAARARRLLEASRAKLVAGKVSRLDVFRAEQFVAQADLQKLDASTAVQDAEDRLRLLMSRDSDFAFSVSRTIVLPTGHVSEAEAVTLALGRRLELDTADDALRKAQDAAWLAGRQWVPQVDVGVALLRQQTAASLGGSLGASGFHTSAFLAASVPVDRAAGRAAVERAALEVERLKRAREALQRTVSHQARHAVRNYERLLQGLALIESGLEQARQEAELAQLRYDHGLSNNLDLTSAEENLLAVRARRAGVLGQVAVAWLEVRAAAGILDPVADIR